MDIPESLRSQCDPRVLEHVEVAKPPDLSVASLPYAIIFVHTHWSAPSVMMWMSLANAVAQLPEPWPKLIVMHNDDANSGIAIWDLLGEFHGNGETFLVKNGLVFGRLSAIRRNASARSTPADLLERLKAFSQA